MSYKYMLLDSRGAPVAQGVSEDVFFIGKFGFQFGGSVLT